jgi:hypothetical protein
MCFWFFFAGPAGLPAVGRDADVHQQSAAHLFCRVLAGPGWLCCGAQCRSILLFTSLIFSVIVFFVLQWCQAGIAGLPAVGRDAGSHPGSTILDVCVCVLQGLPGCLPWGVMQTYIKHYNVIQYMSGIHSALALASEAIVQA